MVICLQARFDITMFSFSTLYVISYTRYCITKGLESLLIRFHAVELYWELINSLFSCESRITMNDKLVEYIYSFVNGVTWLGSRRLLLNINMIKATYTGTTLKWNLSVMEKLPYKGGHCLCKDAI